LDAVFFWGGRDQEGPIFLVLIIFSLFRLPKFTERMRDSCIRLDAYFKFPFQKNHDYFITFQTNQGVTLDNDQ